MLGHWQLIPLAKMAFFSRGVSWRKDEESKNGEGFAVLSIPNIGRGRLTFDAKHRLKKLPNPAKLLAVGDVLFVGSSGSIDNIARNARVTKLPTEPVAFASFTFKATPRQDICDPAFFYFLMNSGLPAFADFARRAADGKFNFQLTSFVERSAFRIPSLTEQRQIATVLSTVQQAIERQERLIALTTELKKALMHKLFTEGTRGEPLKQTEIGPVPESWSVSRLDSFCVLQRGFDITKHEQTDGPVPVVSSGGIKSYHSVAKVTGPGVVVGRKGTLGTVHYINDPYWPHDTTLWVKDFRGNDPRFTAYFLDRLDFARFDSGVSNPTLNRNTVHAETVAYPPKEQQREIALVLSTIEGKSEVHQRYVASLHSLFRSLLDQLMTAQIRVHDLDLSILKDAEHESAGAV